MPKLIAENLTREEFESKKSKGAAEKGGEDEEAEEPSAKEEETPPAAAFGELWRFASAKELWLTRVGLFFAVFSGCFAPMFALILGAMLDSFVLDEEEGDTGNGLSDARGGLDVTSIGVGFFLLGGSVYLAPSSTEPCSRYPPSCSCPS